MFKNITEKLKFEGDKKIWLIVMFLMMMSLLVVYSSTGKLAFSKHGGNTLYFLIKQFFLIMACLIVMIVMQRVHYKHLLNFSKILLFASCGLLVLAKFSGDINDTGRWLRVPFIGLTFQPSEFAKISIVILVARFISAGQGEKYCNDNVVKQVLSWIAIPVLLIFLENFSTSALILVVCLTMFLIGRIRIKLLLKVIGLFLAGAIFLIALSYFVPPLAKIGRIQTIQSRIESFLHIKNDNRKTDDYQAKMAEIAVARGGLLPNGPGTSIQRNFLPHPYSDFIFAIIIEEYGLICAVFFILAYIALLYRFVLVMRRCTRMFPLLVVAGLGMMIIYQAFINMSVCVGLLPVTGQPLPLVSMGGSSMLLISAAFGIILSIDKTNTEEEKPQVGFKQNPPREEYEKSESIKEEIVDIP